MENTSRQKNMRHGAYVDIYQAIEEVKQRVPARVVVLWENARIAELPTLRNLTIDTVKDYVNRVLDFLYAADEDTPADVSRWLPTLESLTAELDEYTEKTPENLRQILEYMVTYASSAHEKVQREISQIYNVDPLGWPDAADDLQQHVSRRRLLSKHDTVCHLRTILSQRDLHGNSQDLEQIKKTLNTIPPSVLSAWRRAHSALSDVLFLDDEAQNLQKVETFGQETFRFIELTEQMFPDDQIIKESKSIVQRVLQMLEDYRKYFAKNPDKENRFPSREYIRKIDLALDKTHIQVSQKTNTLKDSWYFTDPAYLKKFNITPTQQAEWELVKRRRGPRQLFMEELWQDLYKQERGASRRKNAVQRSRIILSQHDAYMQSEEFENLKKTINTIPPSVLNAWRKAHSALADVMFLSGEARSPYDLEKVETFGRETLKFIELAEQMFPDDHVIKESKYDAEMTLEMLEENKKDFLKHIDTADRVLVRPYIRKIDIALDRTHIQVSQKTNTSKDSWYFTDPAYLKRFNIAPSQQAEWELVKRRRGPRQLFMEELWQDLYKQERGASRRKNAAQLCAELRRRAGTVIQFDPKLEKDKKELLGIVDEILKTYTDIYDMSSVVLYALQALTTSPEMPAHISSLHTMLTHLQHSVEQLGEAF